MKRLNRIVIILAIMAVVFVYANMAKADYVTNGLVSYWPLDGGTAEDIVGPNTGTISGGPTTVPGVIGDALQFDGVDDIIDCGLDASLNMTNAVTLESWVWWVNDTYVTVIGRDYSYVNYIKNSGTTRIATQTTGTNWGGHPVVPNYDIVPETWTHVVVVYEDGAGAKLYIDGALVGARDPAPEGDIVLSEDPFTIGGGCMGGKFMTGKIDNVRLYSRGLSAAEVAQNFSATTTAVSPSKKLSETWGKIKASE